MRICLSVWRSGGPYWGVYSKCGARVHEMLQWPGRLQDLVGNRQLVLIGDWNAHHVE